MAHCKGYDRLLDLFKAMCTICFTKNCITIEFVRFVSNENLEQMFETAVSSNISEEYDDDPSSIPLYETSPFYKDFHRIFVELKSKYNPEETKCVEMFLQKYMAYAPMWTSVCHEPRTQSNEKYIPFFRFNTNLIEKYWGEMKERLRAQELEYGKTPVPVARFIRFKKTQVCIYYLKKNML